MIIKLSSNFKKTEFQDAVLLELTIPNETPPVIPPGLHTFAMAFFKTGTTEMIMNLAKTEFDCAE